MGRPPEDFKSVTCLYRRQYKKFTCPFFPWPPLCLNNMCLVLLRHILFMPIHTPWVLLCMFWVSITGPKCAQEDPRCVGAASIFFSKSIDQTKGKQGRKEAGSTFVLPSVKRCWFNLIPHTPILWIMKGPLEPFIKELPFFHYVALSPNL